MRHIQKLWTREEEEDLRALILRAKSIEAIAKKLDRSPIAIRSKATKLKLPLKKSLLDEARTQISELVGSGKILIDEVPR